MQPQHDDKQYVRVSVAKQDGVGFKYDLRFEHQTSATDDYVDDVDGIKVVVDKTSALFLEGATIDWQTAADGRQGFHFDNPNAIKQ